MSKTVEIIQALVSPANKLIDAVTGAIGKAYQPRHIRKMADAKAHEVNVVGQALRENADVPIVYDKGEITADITDFEEFVKRTQSRLAFQELQKQKNIESVADKAYELLENVQDCSAEPVSPDWITRFFNSVEDVSDEDMQLLWAKVLAGEVKKPKSYSLRTLGALKNLSKEEATLFQRTCAFSISYNEAWFILRNEEFLERNKASYADILKLADCGLINSGGDSVYGLIAKPQGELFIRNEKVALIMSSKTEKREQVRLECYPFTTAGCELAKTINRKYGDRTLLKIGRCLNKTYEEIKISAYEIIGSLENGTIDTKGNDLLKARTESVVDVSPKETSK